jgi:putative salt-induced outer membrane protein
VRFLTRKYLFLAVLLAAPAAQAQWTGKAELGALFTNGNSESKSANTKLDLTHEAANWRNNFYLAGLYGESAGIATAQRYEARYQADRKITDRFSWFFGVRGEEDKFSGFAYQATVSTGATYKFMDSPTTKLDGSLGVGYKRFQPQTPAGAGIERTKGAVDDEPVATLGSNYEHSFTDTTKITNKFLGEFGSTNSSLADDLALQVSINQTLALAVGVGVRYNSDPPPLAETTDTQFTVNLVYNIK